MGRSEHAAGAKENRQLCRLTRMEGKVSMRGEDYEKDFIPKDYLTTFYSFGSGMVAEMEILKFSLQNLYQTFSAGEWLRCPWGGAGAIPTERARSAHTDATEVTSLKAHRAHRRQCVRVQRSQASGTNNLACSHDQPQETLRGTPRFVGLLGPH